MQKITNGLLLTGFVLCLLQIWLPAYYLTGDGPCHVYNAQILHDFWSFNKNVDFYHHFYNIAYKPDPNWFSTIVLALLMFVVNGAVAEKILLTSYVLLFTSGFYLLLKKINRGSTSWLLVIFFFVFPHELSKGFYNSTFSIAFYFWAVWGWLRFLEKKSVANGLIFFLFTALVYFTHLLAFGFESFTCAALLVSYALAEEKAKNKSTDKHVVEYGGWLALLLAPFVGLMFIFTQREGGLQLSLGHHFYRLVELAQFKYMANVTTRENIFTLIAGICVLFLFGFAFLKFKIQAGLNKYDGFLLSLLLAAFVYICFPESFMGRLILINMRMQPLVGILLVCCIAYLLPQNKVKTYGAYIMFACFTCLTVTRIYCMSSASKALEDYISASDKIRPYSVVLPLDFSPSGTDEQGQVIADWNFLFIHASHYMALKKPLIILDNYEANMGYFPVRWNETINPYNYLDKYEGMEGVPPYVTITGYKKATGVTIDYILMWCYQPSFLQNEHFRALYAEVNTRYHLVHTSPSGRTVLYEINK